MGSGPEKGPVCTRDSFDMSARVNGGVGESWKGIGGSLRKVLSFSLLALILFLTFALCQCSMFRQSWEWRWMEWQPDWTKHWRYSLTNDQGFEGHWGHSRHCCLDCCCWIESYCLFVDAMNETFTCKFYFPLCRVYDNFKSIQFLLELSCIPSEWFLS